MNIFSIVGNAVKDATGQTIGFLDPGETVISKFVSGVPASVKTDANNWLKTNIPGASTVSSVDSGINSIGDVFNQLKEGNLWLRLGEFAIGIILVGVALAHLTGTDNAIAKMASNIKVVPV